MRVILADDAVLIRQGVARLLEDAGVDVVMQLPDAEGLLAAVATHEPDVVIVDVRMPPTHTTEGLRAALNIKDRHPGVGVLVLSQHLETRLAYALLDTGRPGVGYLLKERVADLAEFVEAVDRVGSGGTVIDAEVAQCLLDRRHHEDPLGDLTAREREVLGLIAEGRSNKAIAEHLFVGAKTVESHVRSLFTKLDLLPEPDQHRRVLAVLAYLRTTC